MLPPVPKIPAADAAYGAAASHTQRGEPKEAVQPQASNLAPDNGSSLFAKAAVTSLASEYQLSRSTAVLAEALGKLMNLPRRDGEAIQTYVMRLTDALRALPAPQRLALEQQVSKVLQGLSLSMLAEILKQPTGPDAARLALLIELSRYKGTDLAAKAVVSSYQQNNSANPVTAQPVQARQQNGPSQSADGRPNPATTTTTTAQPATAAAPGRLLPMLIGPLAQSAAAIKAMVAAQAAPQGPQANLPAPPADMSDSPHDSAKPEGKAAESTVRSPQPQTGSTTKEASTDARPAVKATTAAQLSATPPGAIPQPLEEQPAEKTALATPIHPTREDAETITNRPEAQPMPRAALDPEARMAMLEQTASQSLIAAALAKDGTPLPLVAYPPAEEDHESETPHRGRGPFSEDEANGDAEGENPDGQDEMEERVAANDEIGDGENPRTAAFDDSAENYYLKMSGMH